MIGVMIMVRARVSFTVRDNESRSCIYVQNFD